jgi:DNA-binding transcriptional ArsR family regulator
MSKRTGNSSLAGAAMLFAALGDPTRLALVEKLTEGPASISRLADAFPAMSRQGVTKHLTVLAGAGVIGDAWHGRERVWSVHPDRIAEARHYLEVIEREWDRKLARLRKHLEH